MDPTAQPIPSNNAASDVVSQLQSQLDQLKTQKAQEEKQTIQNLQKPAPVIKADDISAEDILNAFSHSSPISNSSPTPTSTAQDDDDMQNDDTAAISNTTAMPIADDTNTQNPILNQPTQTDDTSIDDINLGQMAQIQADQNIVQPTGSLRKEAIQPGANEMVKYQEIGAELEKDQELEKWVEEVPDPKTVTLPKPVTDDYGDILVQASQIPRPKIILPINEEQMEKALHHKIVDSIRWLYEWAKRVILSQPNRVYYQDNKN